MNTPTVNKDNAPTLILFDYEQIVDPALRQEARARTYRIHKYLRRQVDDVWQIGCDVEFMWQKLPYGLFCQWIAAEFAWKQATAYRYRDVYRNLGGDRFISMRKAELYATTLYKLARNKLPDTVREEIADALASGQIKGNKPALNAEIVKRLSAAEAVLGDSPALKRAHAKRMEHRQAAVMAVQLAKAKFTPEQYTEFLRLAKIAGPMLLQALTATTPHFVVGLITDNLLDVATKLPLTDDDLEKYLLERDSMPPSPNGFKYIERPEEQWLARENQEEYTFLNTDTTLSSPEEE
jgi:hypothetical protein